MFSWHYNIIIMVDALFFNKILFQLSAMDRKPPIAPTDAMVSPWLVSSEVVSAPKSKEPTIIRKSVITTQL